MPMPPLLPTIDWPGIFQNGLDYPAWLDAAEDADKRATMEKLYSKIELSDDDRNFLKGIKRPISIVAIAEDWCGDVVRHTPVLMKMADAADHVHVRFIRRDTDLDVFARFLTLGGEAIPKFVFLSDQFVECGVWGPMQSDCRELIARGKACGDIAAARAKIMEIYQADRGCKTVIAELRDLLEIASCSKP
jgi:hypothetical protein